MTRRSTLPYRNFGPSSYSGRPVPDALDRKGIWPVKTAQQHSLKVLWGPELTWNDLLKKMCWLKNAKSNHRQLHCGMVHVQSQWEMANFDLPIISKSLKYFKFEIDIHDYIPEFYTSASFHFNPFSGGFSPDR